MQIPNTAMRPPGGAQEDSRHVACQAETPVRRGVARKGVCKIAALRAIMQRCLQNIRCINAAARVAMEGAKVSP